MSESTITRQQKLSEEYTEEEKEEADATLAEKEDLAYSYLVRCLTPETVRALGAIKISNDVESLWGALKTQCHSTNRHNLKKVYNELMKIGTGCTGSLAD